MYNVVALVRKHDDDSVDEAEQCERGEDWQEARVKSLPRKGEPDAIASEDACSQRDAEVLYASSFISSAHGALSN